MAEIRNPFNPMRFTGRNGLLTLEEASRLQDLIKGAGDQYTRVLNKILQQFNIDVTNIATTPGPDGAMGIPGLDGADGEDGRPGVPGRDGARGRDGAQGLDGECGADGIGIPGPRGPAGRDGTMMLLEAAGDDAAEAPHSLIVPPVAPFVLALGWGPDNFDGTLPTLVEGRPHWWLHPFTYLSNVSPLTVGGAVNDLGIIDWEVGGSFTRCELDIFVRSASITGDGLDVAVTKNGTDTACTGIIGNAETDQRHYIFSNVGFANGDRMGIHVSTRATYVSGFLVAQFVARLS